MILKIVKISCTVICIKECKLFFSILRHNNNNIYLQITASMSEIILRGKCNSRVSYSVTNMLRGSFIPREYKVHFMEVEY
jgi:hypothetical protein